MEDEGLQSIIDYTHDYKGKNLCNNCSKKINILNSREVYYRFGLTKRLCTSCYKEYKQIKRNSRIRKKN